MCAGEEVPEALAPMAIASGSPMADQTEYRPPTQSQKPKVVVMPKAFAAATLVVSAAK